jgi:hypothetical protein
VHPRILSDPDGIVEHVFEDIWAGIAAARARDLSVGAAGLGPEVCELGLIWNAVGALHSEYLGAFDRAQGYADEQLTAAAWLRTQTNLSHGQAAAQARVAQLRERLPKLAAVWDAGEVSFAHLQAVQAGLRLLPYELWAEVDAALAEVARSMTARELGVWLSELAQSLTPAPKPRDELQSEARRLSLHQGFNGMTNVVGRLTPEVAEKLHAALSAASRPDAEGEVRAPNQRTADALEALLDQTLDSGVLPVEGAEKPHLTLHVDLDQLAEQAQTDEQRNLDLDPDGQPSRGWTPFGAAPEPESAADPAARVAAAIADSTRPRPRFAWTGPTSPGTARRLSCDAILLPIFTRGGVPIDVGRRTRIIPSALRAFIVARDRHCRWPGCTMPPRWTQIHHLVHWRDGGRTDRWNLILICEAHHRAAHSGRYTVTLEQPGIITVRRRTSVHDPYYEIRRTGPPGDPGPSLSSKPAAAAECLAVR